MQTQTKIKELSLLAILSAFILLLGYIEKLFPLVPTLPAVKLGLSNIIVIFSLLLLGIRQTWSLVFVKILLGGILFMGPIGTLLAGSGTLASVLLMYLLLKSRSMSLVGISMAGSLAHMVAQLTVQCFLIGYFAVLGYAPFLLISSLLSGIFIGNVARLVVLHLSNIQPEYKEKLIQIGVISNEKQ